MHPHQTKKILLWLMSATSEIQITSITLVSHGCQTKHEAAKKDVERAFGVLKQKWKLIKYPARVMSQSRLSDVMYTCIILHDMGIHDNGNAISPDYFPEEQHRDDNPVRTHEESMQVTQEIISKTGHLGLKADLVEHI
ncbi:ALP1-like protein [Tanacetum coccineum]